jgi:hypothetical protein
MKRSPFLAKGAKEISLEILKNLFDFGANG